MSRRACDATPCKVLGAPFAGNPLCRLVAVCKLARPDKAGVEFSTGVSLWLFWKPPWKKRRHACRTNGVEAGRLPRHTARPWNFGMAVGFPICEIDREIVRLWPEINDNIPRSPARLLCLVLTPSQPPTRIVVDDTLIAEAMHRTTIFDPSPFPCSDILILSERCFLFLFLQSGGSWKISIGRNLRNSISVHSSIKWPEKYRTANFKGRLQSQSSRWI